MVVFYNIYFLFSCSQNVLGWVSDIKFPAQLWIETQIQSQELFSFTFQMTLNIISVMTYLYLLFLKAMLLCSCSDVFAVKCNQVGKLSLNILTGKQGEKEIVVHGSGRRKYLKYPLVKGKMKVPLSNYI